MSKIKYLLLFLPVCFFIIFSTAFSDNEKPVFAQYRILFIKDSMAKVNVDHISYYLEDKDKNITIKDILYGNYKGKEIKWIKFGNSIRSFGFTSSAYWIRFVTINDNDKEINWLLETDFPHLDSIELYQVDQKNQFKMKKTGDTLPFSERDIKYRNFVFDQVQSAKSSNIYYMRFETSSSMIISLWAWSPGMFLNKINKETIILGIYYGILVCIALYCLFLFIFAKGISFIYFFMWLTGFVMYQLCINGLAFQYFWPNSTVWTNLSLPFLIFYVNMWGLQFARAFLRTKNAFPNLDRVIKILIYISAIEMIAVFILNYELVLRIVIIMIFIVLCTMLIASLISLYYGRRYARIFVIAWTFLFIGAIVYSLKTVGLLPINFITEWSQQIGSLLQIILISVAFADYLKMLNKEKEDAQNGAIRALTSVTHQKDEFLKQTSKKNIEIVNLNEQLKEQIQNIDNANKKITFSEKKYRMLAEGSDDIIFSLDENFYFLSLNNSIITHLKIKPEELISKHFLNIIHEDSDRKNVSKQLIKEKLELFAADKKPVSFKVDFNGLALNEPKEMKVNLAYINIEGRKEIIGKASRVEEDVLMKYLEHENNRLIIGNYLISADEITYRITRNLVKYLDSKSVNILRIALREIIINAIEHGNLNISFAEKSKIMENDNYFEFIAERQKDPRYIDRHVQIDYSLDKEKVIYNITDDGDGFDHKKILGKDMEDDEEMLEHGRGISITKNYFDEVKYNDKGNQVTLVKYF